MKKIITITGAGTGLGKLMAQTLAEAGHRVYASMRSLSSKNAKNATELQMWAKDRNLDLETIELDVTSETSARNAARKIIEKEGRVDVVINNAGMLAIGVTEAFTPQQMAQIFDTNAISWLRVNRAFLPYLREQEDGLLLYVGSVTTSVLSPFQGPYVASKAAGDILAYTMHLENSRYGIETVIVQPGAYTEGTHHFSGAVQAADEETAQAYGRINDLPPKLGSRLNSLNQPGQRTDASEVAERISEVVGMPKGSRPFRIIVDPQNHGAGEINDVQMKMQMNFLRRFGIDDLMKVSTSQPSQRHSGKP